MKLTQNDKVTMSLQEFKKARVVGREELLRKIVDVFKQFEPVAIYQFGSGAVGYKDEFSDLDLWFTFKDDEVEAVVRDQSRVFKSISPVLLKHHSESWSPRGGSATLVIHKSNFGLFQVDYYISRFSETIIKSQSKLLYGKDLLKKGEWILNKGVKEPHTLKLDVSLLVCLMFISVKGLVRKWQSLEFENDIKTVHNRLRNNYGRNIKRRRIKLSFRLIDRLLTDLYPLSDGSQQKAVRAIKDYAKTVKGLYKEGKL